MPVGNSGALLVPAYLFALVCASVGCLIAVRARHALVGPGGTGRDGRSGRSLGTDVAGHPALVGTGLALVALAWAAWWRRPGRAAGTGRPPSDRLALVLIPRWPAAFCSVLV